jgi:hypothetical protein
MARDVLLRCLKGGAALAACAAPGAHAAATWLFFV